MKKLLILLLFIPLVSFGQSYKDVMSISSVDMFKKVAIENGYEFSQNDGDWVDYGFNIIKDSINGDRSSKWLYYNTKDDKFILRFARTSVLNNITNALLNTSSDENPETPYDLITKDIKEKCKYYKIQSNNGIDFVTYSCSDSSYKGKIGFAISDGEGIIRHFIPE